MPMSKLVFVGSVPDEPDLFGLVIDEKGKKFRVHVLRGGDMVCLRVHRLFISLFIVRGNHAGGAAGIHGAQGD
jgi:hypothetical protein